MGMLDQVPYVAIQIIEHRHDAISLGARFFQKSDALRPHGGMIAREIITVQEEEDAPAPCLPIISA